MGDDRFTLPIRVIVENWVPGVALALQKGKSDKAQLVGAARRLADSLCFEFDVVADGPLASGSARLLGPFVQGPPETRFVYLCVGSMAGQSTSTWSRRIKVPLAGITPKLAFIAHDGRLEACIAGRGKDGSPACASVSLLAPGWRWSM